MDASERVLDCREDYLWLADLLKLHRHRNVFCGTCRQTFLDVDAASISLDLACAEASIERTRRGVAWG
jgi:hypothetical protein